MASQPGKGRERQADVFLSGVREVIRNIVADFDLTLGLAGCTAVAEIGPELLR